MAGGPEKEAASFDGSEHGDTVALTVDIAP